LYQLLPTLASVLLLLLGSRFSKNALKQRVDGIASWDDNEKTFATNVAIDWAVTLGVHGAMFSALISVLVASSRPPSFALAFFGVIVVGVLWYILAQALSGPQIGELVENRRFGPAFWCNVAVLGVNLFVVIVFCANNGNCSEAVCRLWAALPG
jgi:hypothetical protein